jgi:signal peptidase I
MTARRIILACLLVLLVPFAFLVAFQVASVRGDSMMPALRDGQLVLALRRFGTLRRGDVVLIRRGHEILVKRVAYLPGDHVVPMDRQLFAGVRDFFEAGATSGDLVVPAERIVVMGDNRPRSEDSRRFGPVAIRSVAGRVVVSSSVP